MSDAIEARDHPVGEHDENGVDLTLIRWFLSLTIEERLAQVQGVIDLVAQTKRVPDGDR